MCFFLSFSLHFPFALYSNTLLLLPLPSTTTTTTTVSVWWEQSQKHNDYVASNTRSSSVPPNIEPFSFQDGLAEGMRTRTVCGVSKGDPPLSLKWLKDGEPLSSLLGANISTLDQYSSLLNIPSLSAAHSGDYTCVASNPAAEVKFTASLQVKGKVNYATVCNTAPVPAFFSKSYDAYIYI